MAGTAFRGPVNPAIRAAMDYTNLPPNPITIARQKLRMHLKSLADAAGVKPQVIYDIQRGNTITISDNVIKYLRDPDIQRKYEEWQITKRKCLNLHLINWHEWIESIDVQTINKHPLLLFFNLFGAGVTQAAGIFCVSRRSVYLYVDRYQNSMPASLQRALKDAGMKQDEVDALSKLCLSYTDRLSLERAENWKNSQTSVKERNQPT